MSAPCVTLVPDLCPRMLADVSFYTTTLHESQGHEWLNDTWRKTIGDHSCTLLNAKCWRPAPQNLSDGQNSFIMPHRNYVDIVAMCESYTECEWRTEFMHFYTSQLCLHSRDVYFTQNLSDRQNSWIFFTSQVCLHSRDMYFTQNLSDRQNSCIFTHRNYVYIVAMCISQWIGATDRIHAFLHIATMFT